MTITNVIIKTPDSKCDWGCERRHARKRQAENLVILKKTLVEIWLWAWPGQASWGLTVGDVGTVSIVKIVSLSPRVEKLKVKKLINVSYLNNGESSVFRISLHLYSLYRGYTTVYSILTIQPNISHLFAHTWMINQFYFKKLNLA